jgi:hypothetical protein
MDEMKSLFKDLKIVSDFDLIRQILTQQALLRDDKVRDDKMPGII